ncbi:MAG: hypothetical protein AAGJ10_05580 [Bacteroidota bacterium]
MRSLALVLVLVWSAGHHVHAQAPATPLTTETRLATQQLSRQSVTRQPLPKQKRWPGQIGLGLGLGVAGGGAGVLIGQLFENADNPWSAVGTAVLGTVGYTVGMVTGVRYAGDTGAVRGNYRTMLGAAAGGYVLGGTLALLTDDEVVRLAIVVVASVSTTMLGHYLSRSYVAPFGSVHQRGPRHLGVLQPVLLPIQTEHGSRLAVATRVVNLRF